MTPTKIVRTLLLPSLALLGLCAANAAHAASSYDAKVKADVIKAMAKKGVVLQPIDIVLTPQRPRQITLTDANPTRIAKIDWTATHPSETINGTAVVKIKSGYLFHKISYKILSNQIMSRVPTNKTMVAPKAKPLATAK